MIFKPANLALALAIFHLAPVSAADRFESVRARIQTELATRSVPSFAVAVAKDGEILWEEGFGWADKEKRVRATEHTMYSLASISKPITATGLMTLVQAGKIDLDRSINDYLGEAKIKAWIGNAGDATVRRVANHTSGLPAHFQFFPAAERARIPSMDETILHYGNLVTAPGERFQYSNLGFGILGYAIARVSGQSYADFMRQNVFVPLGMTHTSVEVGPGLESQQALRYDKAGRPIPFYLSTHEGAGGIYASAHDLVRFAMFHLQDRLQEQKQILSDASIEQMQRQTSEDSWGTGSGFGIGWQVAERSGYHTIGHSGKLAGVATYLLLVPSEDLAVVVLGNGDTDGSSAVSDIVDGMMEAVLPEWKSARQLAHEPEKPGATDHRLRGTWKGSVHTSSADIPVTLSFPDAGEQYAQFGEQPPSLLQGTLKDEGFVATTTGDLHLQGIDRSHPYRLVVMVKLRGNVLNGCVLAQSQGTADSGREFNLAHWVALQRQP